MVVGPLGAGSTGGVVVVVVSLAGVVVDVVSLAGAVVDVVSLAGAVVDVVSLAGAVVDGASVAGAVVDVVVGSSTDASTTCAVDNGRTNASAALAHTFFQLSRPRSRRRVARAQTRKNVERKSLP